MADTFTMAIAQIDPTVGDLSGNAARILASWEEAARIHADLLMTPELSLCGYPPEDLILKRAFRQACRSELDRLARALAAADEGPALAVGLPWEEDGRVFNAVVVLDGGEIVAVVRKRELPNYGVFDEKRVFIADEGQAQPVAVRGVRVGLMICEDMWFARVPGELAGNGAEFLVAVNASPFEIDKHAERERVIAERVRETGLALAFVNQVGGQDEVLFDGASFVMNPNGGIPLRLPAFREHFALAVWERAEAGGVTRHCLAGDRIAWDEQEPAIYQALMLGLKDYVAKNRFPGVILGLSGGIDSALTAAIATDALGPENVWTVMLPSPWTSKESIEDAAEVARRLGVRHDVVPISGAMEAVGGALAPLFDELPPSEAEENIQARLRGLLLMALSNKFGDMVLACGNKSEFSVGYATLYGDMSGGFTPLKDVYKTMVYRLARWRNAHRPPGGLGPEEAPIPERVLEKPPSAELKPGQTDQDTLPAYEILDDILHGLIEEALGFDEIVARGHDPKVVARVERMLYAAEYKRRQAPPGIKITRKSFTRDRRYPITNAFRSAREVSLR
ncbi:MAG: NAD+ synthase [Alphaproteobacteria bacterium]|nr:MAG: NAD+ synthase [Alphaproteobacteria bacterium]